MLPNRSNSHPSITMASRVFPLDEWQSEASTYEQSTTTCSINPPAEPRFRNRLASLPLTTDSDNIYEKFGRLSMAEPGHTVEEKQRGFRGLLRRASISIKSKTSRRRHSHAVQERPPTPWINRLREAASFNRQSRLPSHFDMGGGPVDSCEELMAPIPGSGAAPPVIPRGSGGAARATAAAQNEYFVRHRQFLSPDDQLEDRESGIGIALTTTEPIHYDSSISRVDFVSRLPAELAIQILAHLDHHALANTVRVSKIWAQMTSSPHIWREAFLREKSRTFATGKPITPGAGLGMPAYKVDNQWMNLYRTKQQLEDNWREGKAEPIYLNGHMDSIYCIQFDE